MTDKKQREYDVVVFGATGFTGSLVADYFAKHHPCEEKAQGKNGVRWALAGRSAQKLNDVKKKLVQINPACERVDVLEADVSKPESIDVLASKTRVVLTTVGPFARFGEPLVAACAKHGTDYVDITGESTWVRQMIDRYDASAKQSGAMIVPMCGFDSIPSDLGAFYAVSKMKEMGGQPTHKVQSLFSVKGGLSGGTIHTILNMVESTPRKQLKTDFADPYLLNPNRGQEVQSEWQRGFESDSYLIGYNSTVKSWTAPFLMAGCNTRVVRRSAALCAERGEEYGPHFAYNEAVKAQNVLAAFLIMIMMGLGGLIMLIAPLRNFAKRFLPAPGTGPSQQQRSKSWFRVDVLAESERGDKLHAQVSGADPGYDETAKMVTESAVALALQRDQLPGKSGLMTPASGLGMVLVNRLDKAGIKFQVKNFDRKN